MLEIVCYNELQNSSHVIMEVKIFVNICVFLMSIIKVQTNQKLGLS